MGEHRVHPGPAAEPEDTAADALDAHIDYDGIAARSETDRLAGRLMPQDEVERQVEGWLRALEGERRSA